MFRWSRYAPRLNGKEPSKKPEPLHDIPKSTRETLDEILSALNAETDPLKIKTHEEKFLEILTNEQLQGHDVREPWNRYRAYLKQTQTYLH